MQMAKAQTSLCCLQYSELFILLYRRIRIVYQCTNRLPIRALGWSYLDLGGSCILENFVVFGRKSFQEIIRYQ